METVLIITVILFAVYAVWSLTKIAGLKDSNDSKAAAIYDMAENYKLVAYYGQQAERKGINVNYENKIFWSIGKDREWIKAIESYHPEAPPIFHEKVDISHL